MALKKGKFSKAEMDYMVHNSHLPVREVAEYVNRSEEAVTEFWKSKGLYIEKSIGSKAEENRLLAWLHSLAYWSSVVSSFDAEEIVFFEQNWLSLIKQFNEDASYSEHLYIKDWMILEIEKKRVLVSEFQARQRIQELKDKMRVIESKEIQDELDIMTVTNMATELAAREGVIAQSITSLKNLNNDIKYISDKLKADRINRRERQTSASTYWSYIEKLDNDEKFRREEIYKAEVFKAATEKAAKDLMELHPFVDGTLDRCILNAQSVMLDEEN